MDYLSTFITVAVINFLAVVSPGPDFMLITRNSLIYSRRTGMYSSVGLGLGIIVHVTYCLVGIALLISKTPILFNIIKYLGAAYLIYIGYLSLKAKVSHIKVGNSSKKKDMTRIDAIKTGFICNVTNPKATLFFLSLFTLVIKPDTPLWLKLAMAVEMTIVTILWFMFIAYIFSHHLIKNRIEKFQHYAERGIGVILIFLGLKVAFLH